MSALTQEALRATEVEMTPEEADQARKWAEQILGRELPPRSTTEAAGRPGL